MDNLTIGQRIAACRKNLGLSQEALGEKVGVSRQAISKWEADAAMPEIDKLIALSKLYQVSVGWLLGVEESAEPKEKSAEVSEALLRKIEEIVLRYRPRKQPMTTKKKVLIGLCAALALWGSLTFAGHWSRLSLNVATTSAQVRTNNEQNARIMEKLSDLEARMDAPEDSLLSSYSFRVVPIYHISKVDTSDAEIQFSAVPSTWKEGDTGILSIRHSNLGTIQVECDWDGSFLTASTPLGSSYGYELCFTVRHADGTQEQQMLQDEAVEKLSKTLTIDFNIYRGWGQFEEAENGGWKVRLGEYSIDVIKPDIAQPGDTWTNVDLILYRHGADCDPEPLATYSLLQPAEPGDPFLQAATIGFGSHDILMEIPAIEEGDGLVLWLDIRMSNGMRAFTIIDQWNYIDGTFRNLDGTYEYN